MVGQKRFLHDGKVEKRIGGIENWSKANGREFLPPLKFQSHPWVVLGTSQSEEDFWKEIESTEDLILLKPKKPARRYHVFYLRDNGA